MNPTLVLGYHNVVATSAFGGDEPGLPALRSQFATLARRGAVVPLGSRDNTGTRRVTVALTFDDGYRDNASLAAELLLEVGLPATFYLVPAFLDGTDYPWWEVVAAICAHPGVRRLHVDGHALALSTDDQRVAARRRVEAACVAATLEQRDAILEQLLADAGDAGEEAVAEARERAPMMTWADAKALVSAGFAIGSHTTRHPILAREAPSVVERELTESKARLEQELGIAVESFAYPRGSKTDIDDATVRLAAEAGYHTAVTTMPGLNTAGTAAHRLHRLVVEPYFDTVALVRAVASQLGGAAARAVFSGWRPLRRAPRTPPPSG